MAGVSRRRSSCESSEGLNGPRKGIKGAMSTRRDSTTDKRQKNQYRLAFAEESRGGPRWTSREGPNRSWRSAEQKVRQPSSGWKKSASGRTASRRYDE